MLDAVLGWLALLAPLALAVCAAVFAWRKVRRPLVFLGVAVFLLLAIQAIVLFFVAGRMPPGEPNSAYVQITGVVALLVAVAGGPLLWCLYRGLRNAAKVTSGA
jgi:hypothetical protein